MKTSERREKGTPMNTWKTANAVVRHLEATIPVYDVSEQGHSLYVSLVDGRAFIVDAPFEGDVRITPGVRTHEGGLQLLEDLDAELTDAGFDVRQVTCRRTTGVELRVRDVVDGWAW
jgi:hypothetical protein|nr:MAG TPA: hypothetical protein [Caudoviricetes sp.]